MKNEKIVETLNHANLITLRSSNWKTDDYRVAMAECFQRIVCGMLSDNDQMIIAYTRMMIAHVRHQKELDRDLNW